MLSQHTSRRSLPPTASPCPRCFTRCVYRPKHFAQPIAQAQKANKAFVLKATPPSSSAAPSHATGVSIDLPYTQHKWKWRGHTINIATAGCGDPVILVHGFGLSLSHFRKNIKELSKTYKVYAIDLLGFGASSKPLMQYNMEVWRDQLLAFMEEFTAGRPATLIGNSIGSLACLMAAAAAPDSAVRGVVLLNTAGAMNNKGVFGDWRIVAVYPLLLLIDFLLSIPAVAAALFKNLSTRANIKAALLGVYSDPEAVTDELVELVHRPALDANARDVFVSVITGPPGPRPFSLVERLSCPLLVLWGDRDTLTPADGPVGKFFQQLPARRPNTTFTFIPDVGHCLHDDKPELVHAQLLPWLAALHGESSSGCKEVAGTAMAATPKTAG